MKPSNCSHPGEPIRHSYDVTVSDAGVSTAFGLLMKTMPYLWMRLGILMVASILAWIAIAVGLGGFFLLSTRLNQAVGFGWLMATFVAIGVVYRFFGRYVLYLVKCGHIAVLTELVTKGRIGNGDQKMFAYGKEVVIKRFGQVNVLFVVDALIRGVVRVFNRTLGWVTSLIPVPGLQSVTGVVKSVINAATTYIDETIFSYNLARGDDNPWRSSKDGIIYYAQNAKPILKTAIWAVVLDKVLSFVIWLLMLIPAALVTWVFSLPTGGTFFTLIVAATLAANLRAAFLKPLFLVMIMTRFHKETHRQPINETWDDKLTDVSDKFKELKNRARGHGGVGVREKRPQFA